MATKEQLEAQKSKVLVYKAQQSEAHEDNIKRLKRNFDEACDLMTSTFEQKMAVADAALARVTKELEDAEMR